MHRIQLTAACIVLLLASCAPVPVTLGPAITDTAAPATPGTLAPPTIAPPTPSGVPSTATPIIDTPTAPAAPQQFLAYLDSGQLLVTNVSGGVIGGTTQYTMQGESDQVTDLVWSPSGEFIVFVAAPKGDQHIFYIYAEGASTPTDLGLGSAPAWSPDSKSVAYVGGAYPDQNIFVTTIDNPAPKQLTFEKNHAWGRPAFAPDGQSLIVSTADRFYMGAQGNTSFTLERLSLDGSGTRSSLPGATPLEGVRLPYDLRVSPDGTRLAFSTSGHLSACASPGAYYVSDLRGTRQELMSRSLASALDPSKERYYVWLSYGWAPMSDALIATGMVVDCDMNSPALGQAIAGPQMSLLALDGTERLIIPGMFYSPSMDRTGTLIAAAHYQNLGDTNPIVEIYSAQSGQLVTTVGPGNMPQFQP